MQLSYHPTLICANFSLQFSEEGRQRSTMAYRYFVHCEHHFPLGEFTAPLHHILPIYNVTINRKNLLVDFHWTFTFCVEKLYDGTHLSFCGTLD
jgi:hypothetical protein